MMPGPCAKCADDLRDLLESRHKRYPIEAVRFTHDEVGGYFIHGRHRGLRIGDVADLIIDGAISLCDEEMQVEAVWHHGRLLTLNNRHFEAIRQSGEKQLRVLEHPKNPSIIVIGGRSVLEKLARSSSSTNGGVSVKVRKRSPTCLELEGRGLHGTASVCAGWISGFLDV